MPLKQGRYVLKHLLKLVLVSGIMTNVYAVSSPYSSIQVDSLEVIQQMNNEEIEKKWQVTKEEYITYYELMQNPVLAKRYSHMEPVEALGIEAKTEQERMRFARMAVKSQYERAEKELAFQKAFDKALIEEYPNTLPFELSASEKRFSGKWPKDWSNVSRVILIVDLIQGDSGLFQKLYLRYVKAHNVGLDIYFKGAKNADIQHWAKANNVSVSDVQSKLITLNIQNDEIAKLTGCPHSALPIVGYVSNGQTHLVSINGV